MSENPFIFGKPVRKQDFYDRQSEIEEAIGFIKKLHSFSVMGERRIGKTSFLTYVLSSEVLQAYSINLETYVVIYLNLGNICGISRELLVSTIVKKIAEYIQIELDLSNVFDTTKAYVKKLASDGKNLVIALDEFEVIAPILDDSFSYWLRFIFQEPNVMAITASQKTLQELETSGGTASPLFNIFANIFLKPFSRSETENMIEKMFSEGGIELREEEITFLADLSGGNPYFIQLVGYNYYEKKRKNRKITFEKFKENMFFQTNDQFESYWKHLMREEKKFLIHIGNYEDDQISSTLKRKGLILMKGGKWEIFSLLFQEFVNNKAKTDTHLID